MTLAESASLVARLSLKDDFSAPLKRAESSLSRTGGTMRTFGGAVGTLGGRIKGLVTGPLAGLIGVGGLLSLGGVLASSISKARDFGGEVKKLATLTGLTAETTSSMARAFEHFNISSDTSLKLVGFLEKNVGLLAARKDGLSDFYTTWGLKLTDTNGKIKDANELLLTTADYFVNKNIPATQKAAALAKLYGRSWQDLIPVLKAGRKGIADAEESARKLGLTISGQNLADLTKLTAATRDWGDAIGGLELQIGLVLVPTLTDLANAATTFVSEHRGDIVKFFKDATTAARSAASTIGDLVGSVTSFWNSIPPGFRDLLVKGIVADRTIKFLFGFSPISAAGGLLGTGFSQFLGRGSSPLNPMYVSGGIGGAGGAGGALGGPLALVAGTLFVAALAEAINLGIQNGETAREAYLGGQRAELPAGYNTGGYTTPRTGGSNLIDRQIAATKQIATATQPLSTMIPMWQKMADALARNTAALNKPAWLAKWEASLRSPTDAIHKAFAANVSTLSGGTAGTGTIKALIAEVNAGVGSAATLRNLQTLIASAKLTTSDPATLKALDALNAIIVARLPEKDKAKAAYAAAEKIAQSTESTKQKVAELQKIADEARKRGDVTLQHRIDALITVVKNKKLSLHLSEVIALRNFNQVAAYFSEAGVAPVLQRIADSSSIFKAQTTTTRIALAKGAEGLARRRTNLTVGEAGDEEVAVLRRPREVSLAGLLGITNARSHGGNAFAYGTVVNVNLSGRQIARSRRRADIWHDTVVT